MTYVKWENSSACRAEVPEAEVEDIKKVRFWSKRYQKVRWNKDLKVRQKTSSPSLKVCKIWKMPTFNFNDFAVSLLMMQIFVFGLQYHVMPPHVPVLELAALAGSGTPLWMAETYL